MIAGHKILAIIPARGGSKGLPGKNLRLLAGKPLLAHTIEEAQKSQYIDRIILSSEDPDIIRVARGLGCETPFVRPLGLAQDDTPGICPIIHAIGMLPDRYSYVVVLQPTSPLRTATDIDECIRYCIQKRATSCISVALASTHPYWMHTLNNEGKLVPLMRVDQAASASRQDLPQVYFENGAIYMALIEQLLKEKSFFTSLTVAYEMPLSRSVDIDSEIDLLFCAFLKSTACKKDTLAR